MKLMKEKQGMLGNLGWRSGTRGVASMGIAKLAEAQVKEEVEPAATKGSDTVALLVIRSREFGDALKDAEAAARKQVWKDAVGYTLPAKPTTRAQAIVAFMMLMRSAKTETPSNNAFWNRAYDEAAYNFRNNSIDHILRSAVSYTRPAPRTQDVAKSLLSAKAPSKSPVKTVKQAAQKLVDALTPSSTPAPAQDTPAEASWTDSIPTWVPWAAGGTLLALSTLLLLRRGDK